MAVNEGSVDFTNDDVQVKSGGGGKDFEKKPAKRFHPEAGRKYRIKFISGEVIMRKRHFNPLDKKYYRCLLFQGFCPTCLAASNNPKGQIKRASDTYGSNILVYETDNDGIPTKPYNADIHFWAFGTDKFVKIRNIINEWGPITDMDLIVECTDPQFQKIDFTPAKKCYYRDSGPEFMHICDDKIAKDLYPLDKFICKEVNAIELVKVFGLDESYIPESVRIQMGEGQSKAQDMANLTPPPERTQQKPAATVVTQQAAQSTAKPPVSKPPAAKQPERELPSSNFADLDQIQNLL